jgi:hypothetical protein
MFTIVSLKLFAITYYISSSTGNDTNNGLSPSSAFRTLQKLNTLTFAPEDHILFKSGDTFQGVFWLQGSGSLNNPIVVDMYGGSVKPIIDGNGYQSCILIFDDDYIEINNLELKNEASHLDSLNNIKNYGGVANGLGDGKNVRYAIRIANDLRDISSFRLTNLLIHDIYPTPINNIHTHKGYGIKVSPYLGGTSTNYKITNVSIDNCAITKTGHYGMHLQKVDTVFLLDNYFYHTGGSGIVTGSVENLLVANSIFDNSGSSFDPRMWKRGSGYWAWSCKNVTVQHNQFMNAHGSGDSY